MQKQFIFLFCKQLLLQLQYPESSSRLQPIPVEERVQLSHLASLYSLKMDYCSNEEASQEYNVMVSDKTEDPITPPDSELRLYPVLTKTPNTTQMDKRATETMVSGLSGLSGMEASSTSSSFIPPNGDTSNGSCSGGGLGGGAGTGGDQLIQSCSTSSFANLERSYCPTVSYSDVDSIASDSKRIKK
jgi:hypothetical protein